MTSAESGLGWDFTPVLDLLRAFSTDYERTDLASILHDSDNSSPLANCDNEPKKPPSLGNFDAIFKFLGHAIDVKSLSPSADEPPPLSFSASSSISSAGSQDQQQLASTNKPATTTDTPFSESEKAIERAHVLATRELAAETKAEAETRARPASKFAGRKARRWEDEETDIEKFGIESSDAPLIASHKSSNDGQICPRIAATVDNQDEETKKVSERNSSGIVLKGGAKSLIPASVTPQITSSKSVPIAKFPPAGIPLSIAPVLTLTFTEKSMKVLEKLKQKFETEIPVLTTVLPAFNNVKLVSDGIHVFVDSSNIVIYFHGFLKKLRGLDQRKYVRAAPFSFSSLVLIMERGRKVARRVLVGSSRDNRRPDYMVQAAQCGYEVSCLERVEKYTDGKVNLRGDYRSSGLSSGSETPSGRRQIKEQGVDEILHMKMLESIVDNQEPSTIVLATGDGAAAEYSDGFFKNVLRALQKGWKVELVAWSESINYAYRSKKFLERWKDSFSIIHLDDFSEELLAIYVEPYQKYE